jgi:hypothetical protein
MKQLSVGGLPDKVLLFSPFDRSLFQTATMKHQRQQRPRWTGGHGGKSRYMGETVVEAWIRSTGAQINKRDGPDGKASANVFSYAGSKLCIPQGESDLWQGFLSACALTIAEGQHPAFAEGIDPQGFFRFFFDLDLKHPRRAITTDEIKLLSKRILRAVMEFYPPALAEGEEGQRLFRLGVMLPVDDPKAAVNRDVADMRVHSVMPDDLPPPSPTLSSSGTGFQQPPLKRARSNEAMRISRLSDRAPTPPPPTQRQQQQQQPPAAAAQSALHPPTMPDEPRAHKTGVHGVFEHLIVNGHEALTMRERIKDVVIATLCTGPDAPCDAADIDDIVDGRVYVNGRAAGLRMPLHIKHVPCCGGGNWECRCKGRGKLPVHKFYEPAFVMYPHSRTAIALLNEAQMRAYQITTGTGNVFESAINVLRRLTLRCGPDDYYPTLDDLPTDDVACDDGATLSPVLADGALAPTSPPPDGEPIVRPAWRALEEHRRYDLASVSKSAARKVLTGVALTESLQAPKDTVAEYPMSDPKAIIAMRIARTAFTPLYRDLTFKSLYKVMGSNARLPTYVLKVDGLASRHCLKVGKAHNSASVYFVLTGLGTRAKCSCHCMGKPCRSWHGTDRVAWSSAVEVNLFFDQGRDKVVNNGRQAKAKRKRTTTTTTSAASRVSSPGLSSGGGPSSAEEWTPPTSPNPSQSPPSYPQYHHYE